MLAVASLVVVQTAAAQVTIAPTRVLLSERIRSHEVVVSNPTDRRVEVIVSTGFKLIRSDSLGVVRLDSVPTAEEAMRSSRDWIRVYPRRFSLTPGASQSVRVLAGPPPSIADGEYWARIEFASRALAPLVLSSPTDSEQLGIRSELSLQLEVGIPVIFRKGRATTGIEIDSIGAVTVHNAARVHLDLRRTGNSAFRGTITGIIRGLDGVELARVSDQFTVEFALRKTLLLPVTSGQVYNVEVLIEPKKEGAAADVVLPSKPVSRRYRLETMTAGLRLSQLE